MRNIIFVALLVFLTFTTTAMARTKVVSGQGASCREATSMLRYEVQRTWDNWTSCSRKVLLRMKRCRKQGRRNWIRTQGVRCKRYY